MVINPNYKYRLRPSVGFVPLQDDTYDFFLSSTRVSKKLKIIDKNLVEIISTLDGSLSVNELKEKYKESELVKNNLEKFFQKLYDWNCIENFKFAKQIENNPFRRVLNFFSDFLKDEELLEKWEFLKNTTVCVVGCGAVGSWIVTLLAQSGFEKFVLIDNDIVHKSNLNRSLFNSNQIGKSKLEALSENLFKLNEAINFIKTSEKIENTEQFKKILDNLPSTNNLIVINCADYPNVDATSRIIAKNCMDYKIPHIIAGGYNLHLSLIGQTIIPFESACFECADMVLNRNNQQELMGVRKLVRSERNLGNLAPLAGVTASFAVNEVLRLIFRNENLQPKMLNRRGEFNFLTNKINFFDLPKQQNCNWCGN
ncbi:hypothetical protein JCM14076_31670 [Methylosoma difficile]